VTKVLIAGYGSIGRRHFQNLLALGQQDILFYRTHHSTLRDEDLAGFTMETDLGTALAHQPDAVVVTNPTAKHLDIAIPAARAGCHILLEKPVSNTLERTGELRSALEQGGGRVLVGYQYRFHPGLAQIANLLAAEAIGRPLAFRAHWGEYLPGWHPWEDYRLGYSARQDLGGGVTLTLSHPLDYARWLLGEVVEVWAFTGRLGELELDVEDSAEIGLRFASGALGSIHLNYTQQPPQHSIEIVGSRGTILWGGSSPASDESSQGRPNLMEAVRVWQDDTREWKIYPSPDGFERNSLFLAEMRHFLELTQGLNTPACSLEDGIIALQLGLAALQSSVERRVVKI
jgi:predicted dehydrogenase